MYACSSFCILLRLLVLIIQRCYANVSLPVFFSHAKKTVTKKRAVIAATYVLPLCVFVISESEVQNKSPIFFTSHFS